jgi:hypothetical protein
MKVRIFTGTAGDGFSGLSATHVVKACTGIVFLTPSVMTPVLCVRYYDVDDAVHQVPASQVLSIDPS